MTPDAPDPLAHTRAWVERAVIGLELCPFARAVQAKGQVRYLLCPARDTDALLAVLCNEMQSLAAADPALTDTTLLIHPHVLTAFADFNDFLGVADLALVQLGLEGVLQVASFHPDYRFADTPTDDLGNATNRSPYPTLHLLREASVERALKAFPDAEAIYGHNIRRLQQLGAAGWAELQAQCLRDVGA